MGAAQNPSHFGMFRIQNKRAFVTWAAHPRTRGDQGFLASSVYHGLTVSVRRRMTGGLYFRAAYAFAHASDEGQDALVSGPFSLVQNSYVPGLERGRSVTDQRHLLDMRLTRVSARQRTVAGVDGRGLQRVQPCESAVGDH
jgi:hypothetical protein